MYEKIIIICGVLVIVIFFAFKINFGNNNLKQISEYTVNNTDEVILSVVAGSVSETGLQFEIKYSGEDE